MPRSLILDCSPAALRPPVTPGTRLSRVARSCTGWRSMSSRLITLMLAGASLIHCWLPEAVTTTVSRSLVDASAAAPAAMWPPSEPANWACRPSWSKAASWAAPA
ncbi:hypothetical protein G6F60_014404 [Rhizopus arrhizus]|nr:hypothetical protein G6F60_014404 [Rhizopus arrhizus]